jgi:hypothetical protein
VVAEAAEPDVDQPALGGAGVDPQGEVVERRAQPVGGVDSGPKLELGQRAPVSPYRPARADPVQVAVDLAVVHRLAPCSLLS